jgi:Clp amino terminal domain, pathogenicity island component
MFQRYTEKARRVVFYARYEASQYGSPYIDTEHLLLGLIREDQALLRQYLRSTTDIRVEIERQIPPRERISTSVEVPVASEAKKVLILAAEESDKLGHPHVGTEHLLLGMVGVEGSLAARLLRERGLKPEMVRERLAKTPRNASVEAPAEPSIGASDLLGAFLEGLKSLSSQELSAFFAQNAEFIDAYGQRWNADEICRGFEALFAPYAKKNASYVVEGTLVATGELCVATVLWKNALLASEQRAWMHRMSVVLLREADSWQILLAQVTPVQLSSLSPPQPSK